MAKSATVINSQHDEFPNLYNVMKTTLIVTTLIGDDGTKIKKDGYDTKVSNILKYYMLHASTFP